MPNNPMLFSIVGAHFRPPAKQVLAHLPANSQLFLEPEPENPYDPNAIKVLVDFKTSMPISQYTGLRQAMEGTGVDIEDLLDQDDLVHLGYIAKSSGAFTDDLAGNLELFSQADGLPVQTLPAKLVFQDGKPRVKVIFPQ